MTQLQSCLVLGKTQKIVNFTADQYSFRHRRETECPIASSSSEEESLQKYKKKLSKSCPQSEPMRRKVYFGRNTINITKCHGRYLLYSKNVYR